MKNLTKAQEVKILAASEKHSDKHIKLMVELIKHGLSFNDAHKIAKKFVGK